MAGQFVKVTNLKGPKGDPGEAGERGPVGMKVGEQAPEVEDGDTALWLRTGMGADGKAAGLYVVVGD